MPSIGKYIQVDDYHTSPLNQEENTVIATLANHLQRMAPPEEATGVLTSKLLTNKKRPFNQEEADKDLQDINNKIETSNTNSPPKLLKKFTFYKNDAWGSTWKKYFVNNSFENMEMKMKRKVLQITRKPLPEKYKEKVKSMGGSELILVIEKMIYSSDIARQHNRFSIPFRQIISRDFLKEEEKVALRKREEFWVTLIDPCYREWALTMRQWNMNSDVYVLNSEYYQDFVNTNNFQPGMMVQLWSFRIGSRLCFVLVRLHDSH